MEADHSPPTRGTSGRGVLVHVNWSRAARLTGTIDSTGLLSVLLNLHNTTPLRVRNPVRAPIAKKTVGRFLYRCPCTGCSASKR